MAARSPIPTEALPLLESFTQTLPLRDQLLIQLELSTGFRIRELLSLTVGQVVTVGVAGFSAKAELLIERRNLKGGRSLRAKGIRSRRCPLPAQILDLVTRYVFQRFGSRVSFENLAAPLFLSRQGGRGICVRQGVGLIQRALLAAGLDPKQSWGSHSLRKTFARNVYESTGHDIDLTRMALGHASVVTTQRYLAAREEDAYEAIRRMQSGAMPGTFVAAGVG